MKPDARVMTPDGVGVFDRQDGDLYLVRLTPPKGWPFPIWRTYTRRQLKLMRDKRTVETYGEATY
jgi:hypothetical protein